MDRTRISIATLLTGAALGAAFAALAPEARAADTAAAQDDRYLRLADLEARFGLRAAVDPLTGRVVLAGGENQVSLCPGMHQLVANGAVATFERPVRLQAGEVYVPAAALRFLEGALGGAPAPTAAAPAPVAAPRAAESAPVASLRRPPATGCTVVIDPGHGGIHTGAQGRRGVVEKELTLDIALRVREVLAQHGVRVVMTRTGDGHFSENISRDLDRRVEIANQVQPDLFVSIHANHAENSAASGFEIFTGRGEGVGSRSHRAASYIGYFMGRATGVRDRGIKTAGFRVIKATRAPAVLVEVGFVSNGEEERRLAMSDYRGRIARAIADGILRALR